MWGNGTGTGNHLFDDSAMFRVLGSSQYVYIPARVDAYLSSMKPCDPDIPLPLPSKVSALVIHHALYQSKCSISLISCFNIEFFFELAGGARCPASRDTVTRRRSRGSAPRLHGTGPHPDNVRSSSHFRKKRQANRLPTHLPSVERALGSDGGWQRTDLSHSHCRS